MTVGLGPCGNFGGILGANFMLDEERSGLWQPRFDWTYRYRHPCQNTRTYRFFGLWPRSGFSPDCSITGCTWNDVNDYAAFDSGEGGKKATYFVKGTVVDSVGAPVNGVTINCFRTSDNLFVGTTTSLYDGTYMVSTPYIGVSHFIVAYIAGSPDKEGTTVNNLTPTVS